MFLTITVDDEANALYVKLRDGKVSRTEEYPIDEVFVDLDSSGQVVGVEILHPVNINVSTVCKEISSKYKTPDFSRFLVEPLINAVYTTSDVEEHD
jgi:uncharacterized protein YuzE